MVSKTAIAGVLSVLVIIQFIGFLYLYTKPRTSNNPSSSNSVRYTLISQSLNLARRTLGLDGNDETTSNPQPKNKFKLGLTPDKSNTGSSSSHQDRPSFSFLLASNSSKQQPLALNGTSDSPVPVTTVSSNTANSYLSVPTTPPRTWKLGSFCDEFLARTFQNRIPTCGSKSLPSDSIKCYGNAHSKHMARCALENVMIKPSKLATALFDADYVHFNGREDSVVLINDKETSCPSPNSYSVSNSMEDGDYIRLLVSTLVKQKQVSSSDCEKWIDKTAFFFTGHPFHVYFRFLDYYNLHKALSDYNLREDEYDIIKVSTGTSEYHYQDFERKLYPNIIHISDLPNVTTCYRRVVLVPKSYASTLFQCKMHWSLKDHCMVCDGRGLSGTDLQTFRKRVIKSCLLDDVKHHNDSRLVLISRKPYMRSPKDQLKKFERVLSNENELIDGIKTKFPSTNVTTVHLEDLPICDQVFYANQADVLLAVHGAGLVHLWWLRDDSLVIEMEPHYEAGNPSFKVLSKLTGRKYLSHFIGGGWGSVNANIKEMLNIISSHGNLH